MKHLPMESRAFPGDQSGVSAIEFALVTPLLCLILAAVFDFGLLLYVRFEMNAAVSTGSNYAIVNGGMASSQDGAELAARIAVLTAQAGRLQASEAEVVVNNGPTARRRDLVTDLDGTASNADACYCPGGAGPTLGWGSPVGCGQPCPDGQRAGKFVLISARRYHQPLFYDYGLLDAGNVSARVMVRVQ